MLWLTHVRKSRSPRALLLPLDNLNSLHIRRIDLEPHLHTNASQLVAQQDTGVDAATADVYTDTSEWVTGLLAHEEDVSDLGAFWVRLVEEVGAHTGWVKDLDLRSCEVVDWRLEGLGRGWWWWVGLDLAVD